MRAVRRATRQVALRGSTLAVVRADTNLSALGASKTFLCSVAKKFLDELDLGDDSLRSAVVEFMPYSFALVNKVSKSESKAPCVLPARLLSRRTRCRDLHVACSLARSTQSSTRWSAATTTRRPRRSWSSSSCTRTCSSASASRRRCGRVFTRAPSLPAHVLRAAPVTLFASRAAQDNIDRLENGLNKLHKVQGEVDLLVEAAKVMAVEVEQKVASANVFAEQVGIEKEKVNAENGALCFCSCWLSTRAAVRAPAAGTGWLTLFCARAAAAASAISPAAAAQVEAEKCAVIAKEVSAKQASCEADLAAAEPLVAQAEAALDTLNKKDLGEAKSLKKPPQVRHPNDLAAGHRTLHTDLAGWLWRCAPSDSKGQSSRAARQLRDPPARRAWTTSRPWSSSCSRTTPRTRAGAPRRS